MKRQLSVTLTPMENLQLERLVEQMAADVDTDDIETLDLLAESMLLKVLVALDRPGSWEREAVERLLSDLPYVDVSEVIEIRLWERNSSQFQEEYPNGWIGRVISGETGCILHDTPPHAVAVDAVVEAYKFARSHVDDATNPAREIVCDVPDGLGTPELCEPVS